MATARLASAGCKDMARQIDGRLRALASLRGLGVCHAASAVYSSPVSWRWQLPPGSFIDVARKRDGDSDPRRLEILPVSSGG